MARVLTIRNLYDKVYSYLPLSGEWAAIGEKTEDSGLWLIYGKEKNGKTTFALKLANYLSTMRKVLYVSAEENTDANISITCQRVGIQVDNKTLHIVEYIPMEELKEKLEKRKSAQVVFIDNTTEYRSEMKNSDVSALLRQFPGKLFIFLAHESDKDKGEPDIALAKFCKKKAKRVFHVVGLTARVLGRTETAVIPVDMEKAALCHGDNLGIQPVDDQ